MFDDSWERNQTCTAFSTGYPRPMRAGGARRRNQRRLPLRQICLFVLAVLSFKVFLVFELGGAAYGAKMAALAEGNMLERFAGRAMALDPVSEWIVEGVRYGTW